MNGHRTERQTQSRWGSILSVASCGFGVGGFQNTEWPASPAVDRHSHAAEHGQRQQRALTSVLAVHDRRAWLDFKGHHYARPEHPGRPWADISHTARTPAKPNQLVCRDMGTTALPLRHGLRSAVFATRRVRQMVCLKQIALPDYRAKRHPYRPDYRAGRRNRRPDYRSCYGKSQRFLGPIIGLLLALPSVVVRSRQLSVVQSKLSLGSKARVTPHEATKATIKKGKRND